MVCQEVIAAQYTQHPGLLRMDNLGMKDLGMRRVLQPGQPWTVWHCTQKSHLPSTDCPWRFPICTMHHQSYMPWYVNWTFAIDGWLHSGRVLDFEQVCK